MTKQFDPRRMRGIAKVRADASDPARVLADLNRAFEEFKASQEDHLAAVEKRFDDVVSREKVDRINAEITGLQSALDEVNRTIAASRVGGGGAPANPAAAEHAAAFETWFRTGAEADLNGLAVNAGLTTDSNPDGGYLVPERINTTINEMAATVSSMRSVADVVTVGGAGFNELFDTGGAGFGWVGEREARPETATSQLVKVEIPLMEIFANPATSQRTLDDAESDVEGWLASKVSRAFADAEGSAFINGDGVSKPRGFLAEDMVANSSWVWGKLGTVVTGKADGFIAPTSSASPADCLIDLYYALKSTMRMNGTWMMNDETQGAVRKFKDANGTFVWAPPSAVGELPTILGKPVVADDNMPAVAAGALPIAFGDFKQGYVIADRFGIRVLRDPFTDKPNVHFYTTKRVGGKVRDFQAIKVLKVST